MPEALKTQPVVEISQEEMATFAAVAKFLGPRGVKLVCLKCDQPFTGSNSEFDPTFSVSCGCREFKSKNPHQRRIYF